MPVRGDGGISPSDPSQGSQHVNDNACAFRFVPPWRKIGYFLIPHVLGLRHLRVFFF